MTGLQCYLPGVCVWGGHVSLFFGSLHSALAWRTRVLSGAELRMRDSPCHAAPSPILHLHLTGGNRPLILSPRVHCVKEGSRVKYERR